MQKCFVLPTAFILLISDNGKPSNSLLQNIGSPPVAEAITPQTKIGKSVYESRVSAGTLKKKIKLKDTEVSLLMIGIKQHDIFKLGC